MTDLEALVVAAYVFADEYPVAARGGRPSLASDAELVALAVAQAAIGISSDRQFLGLIGDQALAPSPCTALAIQAAPVLSRVHTMPPSQGARLATRGRPW